MRSIVLCTRADVSRLPAAAALAAVALLGTTTGAINEPAAVCAAPKDDGFNDAYYELCRKQMEDLWFEGKLTDEQYEKSDETCCVAAGGSWALDLETGENYCEPIPAYELPGPAPGQRPQVPGPTEATRVPPPPPTAGPIVTLPNQVPGQTG
ncbi:hypothetical protein [Mycolicibacterium celeriflavum]|uniref:hypothetical protein n=1 Tax=Mycolicibacterium celeriflavum TaxID=1249101 RepID=UPI003CECA8BA